MKSLSYYEPIYDKSDTLKFFKSDSGCVDSHFHRCIEIHYLLSGEVTATVNGITVTAKKDDILFIPSFAQHSLTTTGNYFSYVSIIGTKFSNDFYEMLKNQTFDYLLSDKQFNAGVLYTLQEIEACGDILNAPLPLIKGYINVLVGKLLSHYPTATVYKKSSHEAIAIEILDYINTHYKEKLSLQDLADHFGYNKCYFSKLFNSFVKGGLNGYVNMIRIQHIIAESKKKDNINVLNLVLDNGFDSLTTFYRNFELLYGKPPLEILKKKSR